MVEFDVFEESFNVNFLFPSIIPCTQVKQHWNVLFYLVALWSDHLFACSTSEL